MVRAVLRKLSALGSVSRSRCVSGSIDNSEGATQLLICGPVSHPFSGSKVLGLGFLQSVSV